MCELEIAFNGQRSCLDSASVSQMHLTDQVLDAPKRIRPSQCRVRSPAHVEVERSRHRHGAGNIAGYGPSIGPTLNFWGTASLGPML